MRARKHPMTSPPPYTPNFVHFCFHPQCPQPLNRLITHTIHGHQQCAPWILDFNFYLQNLENGHKEPLMVGHDDEIRIMNAEKPLDSVMMGTEMKGVLESRLAAYLDGLKDELLKRIDTVQEMIRIKIQAYMDPIIRVEGMVKEFLGNFRNQKILPGRESYKILEIIDRVEFQALRKSEDIVFQAGLSEIEEALYKQIKLLPKILAKKQKFCSDINLSPEQKSQLTSYLKEPTDDHNKKIAKLSNLLNKQKQQNIYQKKLKPLPNPSLNISFNSGTSSMATSTNIDLTLKCPLCLLTFCTEKKKQLMGLWEGLEDHLLGEHLEEIGYYFQHLISGKETGLICIEEIVYKMSCYGFQALEFVHKSARQAYTFSYQNRKRLSIDVVYKGEGSGLPLKHILVVENSQFVIWVLTIAYHLQKKEVNKPIYVHVRSKIEINMLRKFVRIFELSNLNIVAQSRNQQTSHVFYQSQAANSEADEEQFNNIKSKKRNFIKQQDGVDEQKSQSGKKELQKPKQNEMQIHTNLFKEKANTNGNEMIEQCKANDQ